MRWRGREGSTNIEDRRGMGPPARVGAVGCGGLVLVLVLSWLTGADPMQLLALLGEGGGGAGLTEPEQAPATGAVPQDELGQFASVVLRDTEMTWSQFLGGGGYQPPRLVLFDQAVRSACGFTSAAVGPFYCPPDRTVYLDLSFFDEMSRRFGAEGDFAAAYVIAHEVGHHVQNLTGLSEQVQGLQQRASPEDSNALSVMLELQADCLAGVWGHHANTERQLIEPGDFEEGLRAASAIGDDALQRGSGGAVRPESWTHGSSAQRSQWLRRGLETGDPRSCDTFEKAGL